MKKLTKVLAGTVLAGGIGVGVYAFSDNTPSVFAANNVISEKQAKEIALQQTNGGSVKELELDRDEHKDKYEIEVHKDGKEFDLDIHAQSGEITKFEEDMKDDRDDNDDDEKEDDRDGEDRDDNIGDNDRVDERDDKVDKTNVKISPEQAKNIALKEAPGTVKEIELDKDDGKYVYEIEIKKDKKEIDVDVDGMTGKVLKVD